jgi:dihydrofolate reductase/thymidylate synthase
VKGLYYFLQVIEMTISIIVAFAAKGFGIGCSGNIPWHIPEDLARFRKLTEGGVVVMGRGTWDSIPAERRPLKGRLNVVVTNDPSKYEEGRDGDNVVFTTMKGVDDIIKGKEKVFIIGGEALYKMYVGFADNIYATVVEGEYACDRFFPIEQFALYQIEDYSPVQRSQDGITYRYITYKYVDEKDRVYSDTEHSYRMNMYNILDYGKKRDDRTGVGTIAFFGLQFRFDISKNIPLLTTKFVGFNTVLKELLFFLQGKTDSKELENQGVGIWKANTTREFLDGRGLTGYREGDMGPMYGFNWRHFGAEYKGCDVAVEGGYDQLEALIDGLKKDPYSRRHMITTFNPATVSQSVLAPCHGIVAQFYVEDGGLSCQVYCRSSDSFLGLPFNIASYAIMTYIIAKKVGLKPAELILVSGDCHIYKNHIEQVKTQLERKPLPFPVLRIDDSVADKSFDDICLEDFELVGYLHHPAIKAPMAV